jgi:hypothetical protein
MMQKFRKLSLVVFQLYGSVRLPAAPLLKYNPFFDDYTSASGDR